MVVGWWWLWWCRTRYLAGKPMAKASRDKAEQLITGLKSLATLAQEKEEEALK